MQDRTTLIEEQFHLYIVNTLEYGFRSDWLEIPVQPFSRHILSPFSKFYMDGIKCNQYAFLSQIYPPPCTVCPLNISIWMLNSIRHFTTNFIYPNPPSQATATPSFQCMGQSSWQCPYSSLLNET